MGCPEMRACNRRYLIWTLGGMLAASSCCPEPKRIEYFDLAALEILDFDAVDPLIWKFLEQALRHETIGKPVTEFEEMLAQADFVHDYTESRRRGYQFVLPLTSEQRENNEAGGIMRAVQLTVRVDVDEKKVDAVAVVRLSL
ncbi:hypothetical protein AB1L42_02460 [Thalassoglobus sp. JC818]|uniref:hypothetical protein n=1 Tax=Thalassoglobus sp. JC818 TaxID=3232136 RepID=UPI003459B944